MHARADRGVRLGWLRRLGLWLAGAQVVAAAPSAPAALRDEARAELLAGVTLTRSEWLRLTAAEQVARVEAGAELHSERVGARAAPAEQAEQEDGPAAPDADAVPLAWAALEDCMDG